MTRSHLTRRRFVQTAAATALAAPAAKAVIELAARPNIVFVTMDELRYDALAAAGNRYIRTPNIDALAAAGTTFATTYCQGPLCQPARASLITGRYVKQTGQSWNGFDMKAEWPTMMKAMQKAGYTTAVVGKTHFMGDGRRMAGLDAGMQDLRALDPWTKSFGIDWLVEEFDHMIHKNPKVVTPYTEYLRGKGLLDKYRAEIPGMDFRTAATPLWQGRVSTLDDEDQLSAFVAGKGIEFLQSHDTAKPFFLWVSFIEPHPPVTDSAVWHALYKDMDIPTGTRELPDMPDNAWGKYLKDWVTGTRSLGMTDADALQMARHYYGLVTQVDHRIGMIRKAIVDRGLDKNTWIVFSADHGDMLGQHNLVYKNVFYKGSVRVPNIVVPPGGMSPRVVTHPVESIDITATMLDLAGASLPGAEGRSLLAAMNGGGKPRDVVHSELAGHRNMGNYFVMAATERYRYTYDTLNKLPCELFDLREDPDEMHNLIDDGAYAGIRSDMHKDYIQTFAA